MNRTCSVYSIMQTTVLFGENKHQVVDFCDRLIELTKKTDYILTRLLTQRKQNIQKSVGN